MIAARHDRRHGRIWQILGPVLLLTLPFPPGPALRAHPAAADAPEAQVSKAPVAAVPPPLRFHDEGVLVPPVLARLLDLPPDARADAQTAQALARRLQGFLRAAGYELAQVHARVVDGVIHVFVDEGKLERVVIHGQSSYRTLQVRSALHLPALVFNRFQLERTLDRVARRFGLPPLRYELVESGGRHDPGLSDLDAVPLEMLWTRQPRRYELHVFAQGRGWGEGLGMDLSYAQPEGVRGHLSWTTRSLLWEDDTLESDARLALWPRSTLNRDARRVRLTHALARLRWTSPGLVGRWLRLGLSLEAEGHNVQRGDLDLDASATYHLGAALSLSLQPTPPWHLDLGGGLRLDGADFLVQVPGDAPRLDPSQRLAPCLHAGLRFLDPHPSQRLDRSHRLRFQAVDRGAFVGPQAWTLALSYRKVWTFGFHELRLGLRGFYAGGERLAWWDERSVVSAAFRLPAPGPSYARHLAQLGLALRLSLHREYFKVGLFWDDSLHSGSAAPTSRDLRAAVALGGSLHFLVLDAFAFDVAFGGTADVHGHFGPGVRFRLEKVY